MNVSLATRVADAAWSALTVTLDRRRNHPTTITLALSHPTDETRDADVQLTVDEARAVLTDLMTVLGPRHTDPMPLLLRLRRRGLSYASLSVIADEVCGVKINADALRRRARLLGVPARRTWNGAGACAPYASKEDPR